MVRVERRRWEVRPRVGPQGEKTVKDGGKRNAPTASWSSGLIRPCWGAPPLESIEVSSLIGVLERRIALPVGKVCPRFDLGIFV